MSLVKSAPSVLMKILKIDSRRIISWIDFSADSLNQPGNTLMGHLQTEPINQALYQWVMGKTRLEAIANGFVIAVYDEIGILHFEVSNGEINS